MVAKSYKVLDITEMARLGDRGGVEKFYRYRIKTALGVVVTVDISEADSTPDKAGPVLAKAAENFDAILKL